MAAASDAQVPELLELKHLRVEDLNPILAEETRAWRDRLEWDFQSSGDLVRRFIHMQALSGYALCIGGVPVGYSYYVCEEQKGLIGDLYVMDRYATWTNENRLLNAVLQNLTRSPFVRRVESQLMMLQSTPARTLPLSRFLHVHERNFMLADLTHIDGLEPGTAGRNVLFEHWSERRQEDAAQLISAAYRGHIDSDINDQYRSVTGARRFLLNIVQYPGCGSFFQPASYLAFDRSSGALCGVSLASLVAGDVGHITQICVSPQAKGTGVGYELMRRSLLALAEEGSSQVSLTVTAANRNAVQLYERMGFRIHRKFSAYVWEGF